jgi:tripartite-type tricarboxylate transporter receptor subunit TctC
LNEEANKALNVPEIRQRMISLGGTVEGGAPNILAERIRSEMARWARLIRERGITAQ